jgi:hypothetical protein
MLEAVTQSFIDRIEGITRETNANPYDKKLTQEVPVPEYDREPYFIYFYYMKFGAEGCAEISHYEWLNPTPIAHTDVKGHVERLARNARAGGATPPQSGARFEHIVWRRISYIVILMDNPNWTLLKRAPGQSCMAFNLTKVETENHSFFDAADLDVNVAELGQPAILRTAVYLVNHMKKDSDGTELRYKEDGVTPDSQKFAFDVIFDVKDCTGGGASSPFIIDPGGTNLGPPIPPP